MKILQINPLDANPASIKELSDLLDQLDRQTIDTVNWSEYNYKPTVNFVIARSNSELFIKYYVEEQTVRAVNTESNQPVYQDSCVEFFTRPTTEGPYLNFEFNAIGTCLMQRGLSRADRKFANPDEISLIRRLSSLGNQAIKEGNDLKEWQLTLAIPFQLIFGETQPNLVGKMIMANFYKCGDKLPQPHYLTWNPIQTDHPDFHRPEFFGVVKF